MHRWLSILLAVLLGGLSPSNAHALTRAGQGAYDAGASAGKIAYVAGITMDTYQGEQSDPLSLHKYLYCRANPANRVDPSGRDDLIELSISEDLGAGLDAEGAHAESAATKQFVSTSAFEFDLGFQQGAGSGGYGPHSFLYVPSLLTGTGLKYDVASDGSLIVRQRSRAQVLSQAWFGKLFKIANFSYPQYIAWTSTAWVVAEGSRADTELLNQQVISSLGLQFSYSFLPGTINCFKWTIVAGIEGWVISKAGN